MALDALEDVADFVGEDVTEEGSAGGWVRGHGTEDAVGEEDDAGAIGGVGKGEGEGVVVAGGGVGAELENDLAAERRFEAAGGRWAGAPDDLDADVGVGFVDDPFGVPEGLVQRAFIAGREPDVDLRAGGG